jgi:transcriptional regulator with XRE-family HTH domain
MTKRADQGGWPPSGFGVRLTALREAAGLSQRALAEAAGVHPNTLAKLERGEQEPAWPLVLALGKALQVGATAFELIGTEKVEPPPKKKPGRPKKGGGA